jgi:fluoroquinolone resistance protein
MAPKPQKKPSDESLLEAVGRKEVVSGRLFSDEDVVGAEVASLHFENCEFRDCRFEDATIRDSFFESCRFAKCQFRQSRFKKTRFATAEEGTACTWSFCDLAETSFEECNLSLNKITRSDAYLTSFSQCVAMGLQFEAEVHKWVSKRLVIGGVKFRDCRLQYATFQERDISRSEFIACDLRDVSFRRSNLSDCSLMGSALSNADFAGATLDGATIAHANFDSFDLTELLSYAGLIVSREQVGKILGALGIVVLD